MQRELSATQQGSLMLRSRNIAVSRISHEEIRGAKRLTYITPPRGDDVHIACPCDGVHGVDGVENNDPKYEYDR